MGLFGLPIYTAAGIYSPVVLSLTAWLRGYAGGTWSGTASAGTSGSGSNDFADGGFAPSVGTALNSYGTADFSSDRLDGEGTLDTYAASTAFSGWAVVKPDTITGAIFETNDGIAGVALSGSDVVFQLESYGVSVTRAISTGTYSLVTFRYNGTNLQVGVNEAPGAAGGGATTAYSTAISSLAGTVVLGLSYDGHIAEFALSDTAISDTNFGLVKTYVNTRYGLSL